TRTSSKKRVNCRSGRATDTGSGCAVRPGASGATTNSERAAAPGPPSGPVRDGAVGGDHLAADGAGDQQQQQRAALRGGLLADDCELPQARPAAPVVFRDVTAIPATACRSAMCSSVVEKSIRPPGCAGGTSRP